MTRIKICGIMETAQALAAAAEGADYIGLVFAPSRRKISAERAAEITAAVRSLPHPPACTGPRHRGSRAAVCRDGVSEFPQRVRTGDG